MKILKIFSVAFALIMLFYFSASAEEENYNEYYKRQYQASGADDLSSSLDSETKKLLDSLGIDISDLESIKAPELQNVFAVIFDCIKNGISKPLSVSVSLIGIMLIFSLINAAVPMGKQYGGYTVFVCLACGVILLTPAAELIKGCEAVLKSLSGFMVVFVPVLAAVTASAGYGTTSSGMSAMLIGVTQLMSQFVAFFFVPAAGGIMCLGVCSSVSPFSGIAKLCELIKKGALWCFGIATTIFSGVLSMQTSVSAAADTIGIKTSKTIISSMIPVMGPAISETLGTARGCLDLLRSGVGIYGIAGVALTVLPMLVSLICWRIGLWLCSVVSEIFEIKQAAALFKAVDFCIAVLSGALIFAAMLFIISITVVTKAGG